MLTCSYSLLDRKKQLRVFIIAAFACNVWYVCVQFSFLPFRQLARRATMSMDADPHPNLKRQLSVKADIRLYTVSLETRRPTALVSNQ